MDYPRYITYQRILQEIVWWIVKSLIRLLIRWFYLQFFILFKEKLIYYTSVWFLKFFKSIRMMNKNIYICLKIEIYIYIYHTRIH